MRTKFAFLSALFLLFAGQVIFAQVTGTVQDEFGPVVDAEVTVKGGDGLTFTDENGKFEIDAKIGDSLVITDIMGNTREYSVTRLNMGNLQLDSVVELEVVTLTGSVFDPTSNSVAGVTIIDQKAIETLTPSMSVDQMLSGKIAGLNSVGQQGGAPGGVANVIIRGALGLTGGVKSPLYVVNGAYLNEDDVNSINPNDVESIEVLKEASKLAVYGSRGANGVVVIKTKSARKGQSIINYRTSMAYSELMSLPNFETMNSSQLLDLDNQLFEFGQANGINGLGVSRTPEQIAELSKINTDWEDVFTKRGYLVSHYVSITTGSDNVATNFSLGYDSNSGNIVYYKGFNRISGTFNTTVAVNDRFNYGLNMSGAYTTRDNPRDRYNAQSPFYSILNNRPYTTPYEMDADGNVVLDQYGDPKFNTAVNATSYAALDELKYTNTEYRNLRLFGSGFMALEIFRNVTARTTFGLNYDRAQNESFGQPRSILSDLLGYGGWKWDSSSDRLDYNWRNEVAYVNSWGEHSLRATLGSEYINENNYYNLINSRGYPNNIQDVQVLGTVIPADTYTNRWELSRFGYLGVVNYDYDKKYFLDVYARRDGTSLAGLDNQYGFFWGASVAWDLARENFLSDKSWLDAFRLSASYGESGDDSGLARYSNILKIFQSNHHGTPYSYVSTTIPNRDVTWENNKKLNLGLDFGFFNKRLTGSFAYFNDKRTDFLFVDTMAPEVGSPSVTVNAGELENSGIEFALNYDVLKSKTGLNLSVYGNVTNIKYTINELANGETEIFPSGTFESMIHRVGETPYSFYMVRYYGVDPDTGQAIYLDKDGNQTTTYSAEDMVLLEGKSPLPTLYGGFGLNAEYKGFNLRADFNYQSGAYMYNNTYFDLMNLAPGATNNHHVDAFNYWQNPGDTNVWQAPSAEGFRYSDLFLEKSDYVLFRSLELGYSFDKKLFERLPISGFRVFVQAQNLALWTKYHGNPIVGTGSSESSNVNNTGYVSGAFTAWSYPLSRVYTLGLNIQF